MTDNTDSLGFEPDGEGEALIWLGDSERLWESTIFRFIERGVEDFDQFMDFMAANVPRFDAWLEQHDNEVRKMGLPLT